MRDLGLRIVASFLILWTPFFFFSAFRGHLVPAAELLYSAVLFAIPAAVLALLMGRRAGLRRVVVLALLVGIFLDLQFRWFGGAVGLMTSLGLVGLFWMLREHLVLILTAVFATTLASTVLAPPPSSPDEALIAPAGAALGISQSRVEPETEMLVHVILDEFAGLQGFPEEIKGGAALRSELARFFEEYGFSLYPRAFSEYPSSKHSIGTLLNFEASNHPKENFRGKRPYVLLRNRTFEWLNSHYSEIHVTQSNYMDFCSESKVPVTSCLTYRFDGSEWLATAALSDDDKLDVLLGMYFNMPGFFEFVAKTYVRTRNPLLELGITLPALRDWDGTVAPIVANRAFDHFSETVVAAGPGTAHFAHLLLPHGPYVYDAECRLTSEPLDWLGPRPRHEKENTTASRTLRYEHYLPQVRCTLKRLGEFFAALQAAGKWQDTTIILHGDHGSRFFRTKLLEENREQVTQDDLADGYSTLFAIRPSRMRSGDDPASRSAFTRNRAQPVSRLLAQVLGVDSGDASPDSAATVYLEGDDGWFEIEWRVPALEGSAP